MGPGAGGSPVIVIYNIPTGTGNGSSDAPAGSPPGEGVPVLNHDAIYNLFSCYGDVMRVRVMVKPPNAAMVEYATPQMVSAPLGHGDGGSVSGASGVSGYLAGRPPPPHCACAPRGRPSPMQAEVARTNLHRLALGIPTPMNVTQSKHTSIAPPASPSTPAGAALAHEVRDYTDSPHHRFKRGYLPSRMPNAPCPTLYFTNGAPSLTEALILSAFAAARAPPPRSIRFIPSRAGDSSDARKSGFMDYVTPEEGALAIALCNNINLDGHALRIAFAAKPSSEVERGVYLHAPQPVRAGGGGVVVATTIAQLASINGGPTAPAPASPPGAPAAASSHADTDSSSNSDGEAGQPSNEGADVAVAAAAAASDVPPPALEAAAES